MNDQSPRAEVVLDCPELQQQTRPLQKMDPVIFKALCERNDAQYRRMVGWSCVFMTVGTCLLAGGGIIIALSLTLETSIDSVSEKYNLHMTAQGAALLSTGITFILVALVKNCRRDHA